jgi:hypothetical protein
MSNISARPLAALFVSCILASAQVFAQSAPAPIAHNGITYVTGGIGEDEVHAFHEVAANYNMRITLASKAGHYLSDVEVKITSGQREVLVVRTAGPFLFASVPAGRYQVVARDRHLTETKQVVVPRQGGIDVRFYWDDPDRHDVMLICRRCPNPGQQ